MSIEGTVGSESEGDHVVVKSPEVDPVLSQVEHDKRSQGFHKLKVQCQLCLLILSRLRSP